MTQFRPRSSLIYSSIVLGLCAVAAIITAVGASWDAARPVLGFLAALAAVAFAAYLRPAVVVHGDRAELVNVVTIATVPFSRLASISTRWALELQADDASKATAFAAPAPGAVKARSVAAHQKEWDPDVDTLILSGGPSTSTTTASGAAAHLIDDAYQAWKAASPAPGETDGTQPAPASGGLEDPTTASAARTKPHREKAITRRPNWPSIAVLVVGFALFALSA